MQTLYWVLQYITTEHIRTLAALIQALGVFGVIAAAFLAYWLNLSLEEKKFELKLREIIYANTEKRRLEVLEKISELTGKLIFEMRYVPVMFDELKPTVEKMENESHESWLGRHFSARTRSLDAVNLELYHAEEAYSIYLPEDLVDRLQQYRMSLSPIVGTFIKKKMTLSGLRMEETFNEFITGWEAVKKEQRAIVRDLKKLMSVRSDD